MATRRSLPFALGLMALLPFAPAPLLAQQPVPPPTPQPTVTRNWQTADQCAKDAFRKYPDYTAAAKAKRDAMQQECLRNARLPAATAGPGTGP